MGYFAGIIVTFLLLLVLGWVPVVGPLIAGAVGGYVAGKGAGGGAVAGFIGGIFGGILLGVIVAVLGTAFLGPLGAFLGLLAGGVVALKLIVPAILAAVGDLIGGALRGKKG